MSSGLQLPAGMATQTLISFSASAIENGFILQKTYFVQEAGRPPMQVQRSIFYPSLKEVVENLESDVS